MKFFARVSLYIQLVRLDRPIGILLLLWPTLWALWIAGEGRPDALIVAVCARLAEQLIDESGFAMIDVRDDGHISEAHW